MITIKNITKYSVVINAADGDSVILTPQAIITTDDKFLWQLDDSKIKIVKRSDDGLHHRSIAVTDPETYATYSASLAALK